jgi:hypothetical protein
MQKDKNPIAWPASPKDIISGKGVKIQIKYVIAKAVATAGNTILDKSSLFMANSPFLEFRFFPQDFRNKACKQVFVFR